MKKKFLLFFLVCASYFTSAQNHSTKGKEFWFAYMENLSLVFNGPPAFTVIISSEVNTTGQIEVPATGFTFPFTVSAMQDTEIVLPPGILYPQGDEALYHFGFKLTSNDSVNVYTYHHRPYFTEATVVVPIDELTSHYMVTAQKDYLVTSPSELVIEATQDSTVIEIIPSQLTVSFRSPGVPFYETLNAGDVFQLQSYYNLCGTLITSIDNTKKIAIFSGARQSSIVCNGADDHLYDQDYMAMFGREFVLVPMINQGGDIFNILTLQDSNYISINNNPPVLLATAGQNIDTLLAAASYVVSEKPICISQYNKSQNCNTSNSGDPCMVIIPPVNLLKYRAIFQDDSISPPPVVATFFDSFHLNIVVPSPNLVTLDGMPITGFQTLAANPQFLWKQIQLNAGPHNLYSTNGFNAFTYALGSFNAYAYHLGFDFDNTVTGWNEQSSIFYPATFYPDPLTDRATITISSPLKLFPSTLELFSTDGKLLSQKSFSGNTVEVERNGLTPGIYFYLIKSGNKIIARDKFLVN